MAKAIGTVTLRFTIEPGPRERAFRIWLAVQLVRLADWISPTSVITGRIEEHKT